jgi:light-regulated signal transduction histidine kinase (bacteriophytochrome)
VVVTIRDITQRKRAELELSESNRNLEEFAYVVSHDLQSPLNTIGVFAQWLSKQYAGKLDSQADQYLEFIGIAIHRMKALIAGLLAHARVATASPKSALPIDCNEVVARTLVSLNADITRTSGIITSDSLPVISATDYEIEQLFQNLIYNAIKYRNSDPPRIHISSKQDSNEWTFVVQDNGIGFDMVESERIFKPFERLHSASQYEGAGMGLAICKRIIELHGGRIWAESQPGKGSTFFFTIPLASVSVDGSRH